MLAASCSLGTISRTCQEDAGQPKCVPPSPRTAAGAVAVEEEEGAELPWDGEMGDPLADEMVDEAAAAEAREAQQGEDEAGVSEERGCRCMPEVAAERGCQRCPGIDALALPQRHSPSHSEWTQTSRISYGASLTH